MVLRLSLWGNSERLYVGRTLQQNVFLSQRRPSRTLFGNEESLISQETIKQYIIF